MVLLRFDEAEDPVSGFLVNRDLPHREHFRVDSWPVLLRHTQDLSLRVSNDFSLRSVGNFLLENQHPSLLLGVHVHISNLAANVASVRTCLLVLLELFTAAHGFREKRLQFTLVAEVVALHLQDGILVANTT